MPPVPSVLKRQPPAFVRRLATGVRPTLIDHFSYAPPVLERLFHLSEHRTTVRTEIVAGVTTFLTMAYIIFVQPTVLGAAGMDFGAVLVATCLASGIATLLMAFLANYPIAVAPAMGHNFFFAFTVVVGDAACRGRSRSARSRSRG